MILVKTIPGTGIWFRFTRFLLVNRLLFLTALSAAALCHYATSHMEIPPGISGWLIRILTVLGGKVMPVFAVLDARSRFQDYKKAKDLFFKNGFKPRIADLFIHSRCQRDAMLIASRELGLASLLHRYYLKKGYQWYHILPDFTFKRPGIYFTLTYWQKTLFAESYRSRYFK